MLSEMLHHDGLALTDGRNGLSYGELSEIVEKIGTQLRASGARTIGLALDNSPLWGALDLAVLHAGLVCVPLPSFFSPYQLAHVIDDSGIDTILADSPDFFQGRAIERECCGWRYAEIAVHEARRVDLPSGTVKITYTSGTTGHPKGVCLDLPSIEKVAKSLLHASLARFDDRYFSILPLSTLLENIGGLYVPLLAGAACHVPQPQESGLRGIMHVDIGKMTSSLFRHRATCTILTPQLLQGLAGHLEKGGLPDLRFVAVGGAPVPARLFGKCAAIGLPVFEGYGLSECASVVSLNGPQGCKTGSVGKPLPHVDLKFADDGEILVKGSVMLGYCGENRQEEGDYWPTGDTGYLDCEGYLYLTGRKRNMFVTSFGRNVSPEWVEKELTVHPAVRQAAVFGEARAWNAAVIVTSDPGGVEDAVRQANALLPDYARVAKWLIADEPFHLGNGQLTANGKLKREAIWPRYRERIASLYGDN